ncbi:MAG: methyltransferase, TIGR04325 family [Candidatus Paceibacterota bacterium]
MKKILKKIIPEIFFHFITKLRYGYFGKYEDWKKVKEKTTGYDNKIILEKVKNSLLKVKNGEAIYERDSVIFDKKEYSWPLLASLLLIAGENENQLNLIDFGGSLGSTYFQNKVFFKHLKSLHWNIVEQPNFVSCGKKYFEDEFLHFYNDIDECLAKEKPSAILLSSVIEYIEKPYELLKKIIDSNFQYIILDRINFSEDNSEFITLQKVPPQIYTASYPCWFFSEQKFLNFFSGKYELLADFVALGGKIKQNNIKGYYKGFIFKIKK